jgi:hypothetical protein
MKKTITPEKSFVLMDTNPDSVNFVIHVLKAMGIDMGDTITGYDPYFKHVCWRERVNEIDQVVRPEDWGLQIETKEEFISLFLKKEPEFIETKINDYDTSIYADHIQVGCQKISFDKVESVYKGMLELQGKHL